jgi:Tfp pilus assembly protein PilO
VGVAASLAWSLALVLAFFATLGSSTPSSYGDLLLFGLAIVVLALLLLVLQLPVLLMGRAILRRYPGLRAWRIPTLAVIVTLSLLVIAAEVPDPVLFLAVSSAAAFFLFVLFRLATRIRGRTEYGRAVVLAGVLWAALALVVPLASSIGDGRGFFLTAVGGAGPVAGGVYVLGAAGGWRRFRPAVALMCLTLCFTLVWWVTMPITYWDRSRPRLEDLRKEIQKLEVTASKLVDFQREVAELELRLEELHRILPLSLDIPVFAGELRKCAEDSGVTIQAAFHETPYSRRHYQKADVFVYVAGDPEAVDAMKRRVGDLERLVKWVDQQPTPAGHEVTLEVYAMPEEPSGPKRPARSHGSLDGVSFWAPEVTESLEAARQRRAELQTLAKQVSELERRRRHFQDLFNVIETLRGDSPDSSTGQELDNPSL